MNVNGLSALMVLAKTTSKSFFPPISAVCPWSSTDATPRLYVQWTQNITECWVRLRINNVTEILTLCSLRRWLIAPPGQNQGSGQEIAVHYRIQGGHILDVFQRLFLLFLLSFSQALMGMCRFSILNLPTPRLKRQKSAYFIAPKVYVHLVPLSFPLCSVGGQGWSVIREG